MRDDAARPSKIGRILRARLISGDLGEQSIIFLGLSRESRSNLHSLGGRSIFNHFPGRAASMHRRGITETSKLADGKGLGREKFRRRCWQVSQALGSLPSEEPSSSNNSISRTSRSFPRSSNRRRPARHGNRLQKVCRLRPLCAISAPRCSQARPVRMYGPCLVNSHANSAVVIANWGKDALETSFPDGKRKENKRIVSRCFPAAGQLSLSRQNHRNADYGCDLPRRSFSL